MDRKVRIKSKVSNMWFYKDINRDSKFMTEDGRIGLGFRDIITIRSVGLFTGVYDINKKEVYEKDIVKIGDNIIGWIDYDPSYTAYVLRGTKQAQHEFENFGDYLNLKIEVIGNIIDNPELLL